MTINEIDQDFLQEYLKISEKFHGDILSSIELEEWYNKRIKIVLNHVVSRSRFYQNHFKDVNIDSISVETLSSLPFTTKKDLQDAQFSILCGDVRDAQFYFATTGTTGPSTPCPRDKKDIFAANTQLAWGLNNLFRSTFGEEYKPIVAVLAPNELHGICNTFSGVCYELGVCKLDPYPASYVIGFEKCIKVLQELRVDVIVGTPGLALILAQVAEMYGIDCKHDLNLNLILCTGELCTRAMANNIKSIYDATVYNFIYASQEALTMAVTDSGGKFVNILPNYFFEVIDLESNESLGFNGKGELCITMLIDGIKPLIRYRTGDLVNIVEGESFGPLKKYMEVIGRIKDIIKINNKIFTASEIEEFILRKLKKCVGYQVVIENRNDDDFVIIRLQFLHEATIDKAVIKNQLVNDAKDLGINCDVEFVFQLDDIVNTGGWISWKAARIIDNRENETKDLRFEKSQARDLTNKFENLILEKL